MKFSNFSNFISNTSAIYRPIAKLNSNNQHCKSTARMKMQNDFKTNTTYAY